MFAANCCPGGLVKGVGGATQRIRGTSAGRVWPGNLAMSRTPLPQFIALQLLKRFCHIANGIRRWQSGNRISAVKP